MKIQPNNYTDKTNFKSLRMKTFDSLGVINCHYTNLNRADIDWAKYAKFLDERYKGQNKVNINLFGSSDCSDGYTLILNLLKVLGEKAKKFFPIQVSDISTPVIQDVQQGKIQLHSRDLEFLKKMDALDFFERNPLEKTQEFNGIEFVPYTVKNALRDKIQTSVQDVRIASKEHNFDNEVFVFRNGWTFNSLETQDEIAKNLVLNSNDKTLVTIGQSDLFKSDASDALQRNGFKGIKSEIFTEAETTYPSTTIGQPTSEPVYPQYILFEKGGKNV